MKRHDELTSVEIIPLDIDHINRSLLHSPDIRVIDKNRALTKRLPHRKSPEWRQAWTIFPRPRRKPIARIDRLNVKWSRKTLIHISRPHSTRLRRSAH